MKRRYDEIMDNINVTDEMRARILNRLQELDGENTSRTKTVSFPSAKKYLAVAACLAILLVGALTLPGLLKGGPGNQPVVLNPGITEASSLEELSSLVKFEVEEISGLPFTPETERFTALGSETAQITYEGEGQTCTFRKSPGSGDNSGDYNSYPAQRQISAGGMTATLKGDSGRFTLAVWSDGAFSYSLQLSDGLSAGAWADLLEGMG